MIKRAWAKINLALDVTGRRPDGYHDVRMIMQTIDLHDVIELAEKREPGIRLSADVPGLPTDEKNLAVRAAKLLMEEFGVSSGLSIRLEKRIPMAAGLAGGSADAAAVLTGVNELFSLGLTGEELMARGVRIGADVPFCILGGTALAEGIGERLTPLPSIPDCVLLIGKPGIDVSTKFVYTNLREEEIFRRPDIDGMMKALEENDLSGVTSRLENVLETVTVPLHSEIRQIKKLLCAGGAEGALMSGSGPTVFGIYRGRKAAEKDCSRLKESGLAEVALLAVPRKREECI